MVHFTSFYERFTALGHPESVKNKLIHRKRGPEHLSGGFFWVFRFFFVPDQKVIIFWHLEPAQRAHRATEGACSTSGRHLVAKRPIRIGLECRIRYFWSTFDHFLICFCHFVFSSKLSILVELWKVFDPNLMVLHGFCRKKSQRELVKRALLLLNRADTSLKPFVWGFGW